MNYITCDVRLSDIFGLARPSPAKLQSVLAQRRTTATEVVRSAARATIRVAGDARLELVNAEEGFVGAASSPGTAILGGHRADTVTNHGWISGEIVLRGGDDVVRNDGLIGGKSQAMQLGRIELGAGDELEARLREDTNHEIQAILTVHVDTASSVRNDIAALRRAIDAAGHPALFMVDCIASLGCERFEMDEWGVDITIAGCQKGLMVPPGVSFVWASDKALAAHKTADAKVGYFDWEARLSGLSTYHYFAGTPPIAHLFGLKEAFDIVEEEGGWEAVWNRHTILSDAIKAAVTAWSTEGGVEFNIIDPAHRANCVTTVLTGDLDAAALRSVCAHQAGLTLGLGIGDVPGFRIGHMGHLNPPSVLGTIGTIESALLSMGAKLPGSGVAAATAAIAEHL